MHTYMHTYIHTVHASIRKKQLLATSFTCASKKPLVIHRFRHHSSRQPPPLEVHTSTKLHARRCQADRQTWSSWSPVASSSISFSCSSRISCCRCLAARCASRARRCCCSIRAWCATVNGCVLASLTNAHQSGEPSLPIV
jgi:hypothetical protein